MKKNNKGFMLAEVIITSTVIITAMVGLYASFQKIYANYGVKSNYYSVDGVYATKEMINHLLYGDVDTDVNLNKFISNTFQEQHFVFVIKNGQCQGTMENDATCKAIQNTYQVSNMIFTEYDKNELENGVKKEKLNQTFLDYLDYVMGYYDITSVNTEYGYLILTETSDGENYYYSNLRVR